MKRVIVIAMAVLGLIVTGCSKNNSVKPPEEHSTRNPKIPRKDGGEDDDRVIIIHRVENSTGGAISNASITYTNAGTTAGGVTDNSGQCTTSLPYPGTWDFSITCSGYLPLYNQVTVLDTTTRVDTLYAE